MKHIKELTPNRTSRTRRGFYHRKAYHTLNNMREKHLVSDFDEPDYILGKMRIRPFIHYVLFSIKFHNYSKLHKRINLFKMEHRYDSRAQGYSEFFRRSVPLQGINSAINVWMKPYNKFMPGILIGVSLPSDVKAAKYILRFLENRLAGIQLDLSYIEYAIDCMVDSPADAKSLLTLFQRYLSVKYLRTKPTKLDNYLKYRNSLRIYSRGKDIFRNKGTGDEIWAEDKIDRVRLEHLLKRGPKMRKLGLHTINDLINDTRYPDLVLGKTSFLQAHSNARFFPKIWQEPYINLQDELLRYRKEYGNRRIWSDLEPFQVFDHFEREQITAIERFQEQWKNL